MTEELPTPDFRRVFDVSPTPFLLLTPDHVIVHANQARLEATATTLAETVGRNLFDVFPMNPDDPAADGLVNLRASLERARDTRRPHTMAIQRYDIPRPDGGYEERFWSPRNVPVLDDDGQVVLLLHRSDDITDYIRARDDAGAPGAGDQGRVAQVEADLFTRTRELEHSNAQLRALREREQRTSRALAGLARTVSALSAAETRQDLLRLVADRGRPGLAADHLAVALHRPGAAEVTIVDGSAGSGHRIPVDSPAPAAVAASGRRVLVPDGALDPAAPAPGPGLRAWAALPLRVGERVLGSLTVGWRAPRPFQHDDVQVLEAYAAQCAQAMDRAARLERERRQARDTRSLAETLQRSLLTEPPRPEGLGIAVRYRPAAREAEVGGDWYDAFPTRDGATTLVVGDVTGHDRTSAAVMGQLRNLLRGVAHALGSGPAAVLGSLDRAMSDLGMTTLATAVLARIESPAGAAPGAGRVLRWSNAGHPPPLLIRPDGAVELLDRPRNLLLGVAPEGARAEHALLLPPGATVVLYTDGLIERRDATLDDGLRRLADAASDLHALPVEAICDAVLGRVAPDFSDDVALVALRVEGDRPGPLRG